MKKIMTAAMAAGSMIAGAAHAQVEPTAQIVRGDGPPILTVSVSESVDALPDVATMTTGVQTRAATAAQALAQNAEQMDKLIAAIKGAGIPERDIQTSGINLNAQYDYSNRDGQTQPRFLGYDVSNQLTVKSRDVARLGPLIDRMVAAGANNLNGPTFSIDKPAPLEDQARVKAVAAAKARAEFYAKAAGYGRVRLVSLSETGGYNPPAPVMVRYDVATTAQSARTKIQPGQVSATVTVIAQYAME